MRKYILKRDLPTFNKGDLFCRADEGGLWHCTGPKGYVDVMAYAEKTLEAFPNILTDWFEEIKEPLIKDQRIRAAVRAWLAIQEQPIVEVAITCGKDNDGFLNYHLYGYIEEARISNGKPVKNKNLTAIVFEFRSLEKIKFDVHRDYTITELCGEEDE